MIKILTERKYNQGISRQTVYEWEDDISEKYNISLLFMDSYKTHPFARLLRKIRFPKAISWNQNKDILLFFAMNIDLLRILAWYTPNVIPILLDVTLDEIDEVYRITKNLPIFWVTAISLKEALVKKYPDCKVCYIPQMASDRYLQETIEKQSSIIQFGRRNPVLHDFAKKYVDNHHGISYIFRTNDSSKCMIKYSNSIQTEIGILQTREEFINYLLNSKICLCSTPLTEHTRDFGDNIDFLTARWYESIMCRCHILARTSNVVKPELEITGLINLIDNVNTYEEFSSLCDSYLSNNALSYNAAFTFAQTNSAVYRGGYILMQLHKKGVK